MNTRIGWIGVWNKMLKVFKKKLCHDCEKTDSAYKLIIFSIEKSTSIDVNLCTQCMYNRVKLFMEQLKKELDLPSRENEAELEGTTIYHDNIS